MAFTRTMEREVKLEADLVFELPDLQVGHKIVRRAPQRLSTAYFDTQDLRLWQRGLTLRHRTGERSAKPTWTLKLPEGESGQTLDRTELSWSGSRQMVPEGAMRILFGVIRRVPLKEIVDLETTRRRVILRDADGSSAELADDTIAVVGGHRDGLVFRQLEIEVGEDAWAMLDDVLSQLRAAGARPDGQPKLAIALGLSARPGEEEGSPHKGPSSTVGDIVRASIVDGLDRLLDHDYRLRLDAEDPPPHDVHQARVATRRLRSDLKLYRPVLDPVWLSHTRSELEWLAQMLGEIRDIDVLAAGIELESGQGRPAAGGTVGADGLGSMLSEQRRTACVKLAEQMTTDRNLDLLDRLHAAGEMPPFYSGARAGSPTRRAPSAGDPARRELPRLVRRRWQVLQKRVRRAGARPSDRALHRIRIAAKQFRYASETAVPVVGKPAARTAKVAEHLQTVLGEHHDAVAAEEWLRASVADLTPAASFVAGRLAAEQEWRQRELRREWSWVWDELRKKKLRRWLD